MACGALGDELALAVPPPSGGVNVQGEVQKKLDVLSNEIVRALNEWGGHLAGMASEEMELPQPIPAQYPRGKYLLLFDPLDGSSNIDVNVSVGSIFSVLRAPRRGAASRTRSDFLQPGAQQVARRLRDLRPDDDARADAGQRRARLHARPRASANSC